MKKKNYVTLRLDFFEFEESDVVRTSYGEVDANSFYGEDYWDED